MADQNNDNENGAANNNADNLNVAQENEAGDDIWDQIFDQNFVADPNAYDYEAHHEVLLQNLQAGHQNMFLHHNGFPMPQVVAQPEAVAHSSSSQPGGSNDVQPVSDSFQDVQSSMVPSESDNLGAPSVVPNMEGWGYVNEAYQTDSSSLSEFVASSESQQEVLLTATKEESPVARSFLEIPERLVKGLNIQASMRIFGDSTEKDPPNPPNTPVSARSDLNISSGSLDCTPKLSTSPGLCLRSAIKALSSISDGNRKIFDSDSSEGRKDDDLTNSKNGVSSTNSATKENVGKATRKAAKVQVKRKFRDDHTEENIQISLSRQSERPDYLFVKFGSFMVILVLLFPLAIIACLQGLLPEKYANAFLILLILSFLGACYFFVKACYVKNDQPLDTTTTSTVRYGSIPNPKPGTSSESA